MNSEDRNILKNQLDKIYKLMDQVDRARVKGSTEYRIMYELEQINMKLDIPFSD